MVKIMMLHRMTAVVVLIITTSLVMASTLSDESLSKPIAAAMEYTSMVPDEQSAFQLVAKQCRADVESLCGAKSAAAATSETRRALDSPITATTTTSSAQQRGDVVVPFLPPPPRISLTFHRHPLEDFDAFFDHFMIPPPPPFLFMSDSSSSEAHDVFFIVGNNNRASSRVGLPPPPPMRHMMMEGGGGRRPPCPLDEMMRHVVASVPPPDFPIVAQKMNDKGSELLQKTVNTSHKERDLDVTTIPESPMFTTARRLQAVTPETLETHRRAFLPFSLTETMCLEDAYEQQRVSDECQKSLTQLHLVRSQEESRIRAEMMQNQEIWVNYMHLWMLVIGIYIILLARRYKTQKPLIALGDRILISIYSRPHLKRAVEDEVGNTIGHVPPIPLARNLLRGKFRSRFLGKVRIIQGILFCSLVVVIAMAHFSLLHALDVAIFVASVFFYLLVYAVFVSRKKPEPYNVCMCCACGLSTESVKLGKATTKQAQCACCSGTGVCHVHCPTCVLPQDKNKNRWTRSTGSTNTKDTTGMSAGTTQHTIKRRPTTVLSSSANDDDDSDDDLVVVPIRVV